jgi:hypothetical protein
MLVPLCWPLSCPSTWSSVSSCTFFRGDNDTIFKREQGMGQRMTAERPYKVRRKGGRNHSLKHVVLQCWSKVSGPSGLGEDMLIPSHFPIWQLCCVREPMAGGGGSCENAAIFHLPSSPSIFQYLFYLGSSFEYKTTMYLESWVESPCPKATSNCYKLSQCQQEPDSPGRERTWKREKGKKERWRAGRRRNWQMVQNEVKEEQREL